VSRSASKAPNRMVVGERLVWAMCRPT